MSAPAQRGAERRWMLALNPMLILVEDRVPLLLGPQRWRAGGQYNGGGVSQHPGPRELLPAATTELLGMGARRRWG